MMTWCMMSREKIQEKLPLLEDQVNETRESHAIFMTNEGEAQVLLLGDAYNVEEERKGRIAIVMTGGFLRVTCKEDTQEENP